MGAEYEKMSAQVRFVGAVFIFRAALFAALTILFGAVLFLFLKIFAVFLNFPAVFFAATDARPEEVFLAGARFFKAVFLRPGFLIFFLNFARDIIGLF